MLAKNKSKASPTDAHRLAVEMWEKLGSKTRWQDDVDQWAELLLERWEATAMDYDAFRAIIVWAVLENEYTVENLRVSKNPAESLFIRQWDNVELFYEAATAKKQARERKKWKYGACGRCDSQPAVHGVGGNCMACDRKWLKANRLAEAAMKGGMVRLVKSELRWNLYSADPTTAPGTWVVGSGTYEEGNDDFGEYYWVLEAIQQALIADKDFMDELERVFAQQGEMPEEPKL